MNLKEFADAAWIYYLRAFQEHRATCKQLGSSASGYIPEKLSNADFKIALDVWMRGELAKIRKQLIVDLCYDGVGSTATAEGFIRLLSGKANLGDGAIILEPEPAASAVHSNSSVRRYAHKCRELA